MAKSGNPFGNPRLFNYVRIDCRWLILMVGERGFEPPTPWSRTRCSTRLSHSPTPATPNCCISRESACDCEAKLYHSLCGLETASRLTDRERRATQMLICESKQVAP